MGEQNLSLLVLPLMAIVAVYLEKDQ